MKRCVRCGNENADEMQFCLNCGGALGQTAPLGFGANPGAFQTAAAAPKKSNRKWWLAIAGGATLLLLLFGGVLVLLIALSIGDPERTNVANGRSVKSAANSNSGSSASDNRTNSDSNAQTASGDDDEPGEQNEFTVAANAGWQLSDIKAVPNDMFQTSVEGAINLGGIRQNVASKGVGEAKERRLFPEYPTGALLMRTRLDAGGYSNIQAVSTAKNPLGMWRNAKDERGKLEFAVNDKQPANNSGAFTIKVVSLGAAK